ncbi:MAG: amidohydrolase [Bdellovibrionales bacterium]|nr:amidohydrolase [Bdellovibrionales bacterium]
MDSLDKELLEKIISLRHQLHAHPELSGVEYATALTVAQFLADASSKFAVETGIGGTGIAAVLEFSDAGPCLVLRAELDALPISEKSRLEYSSKASGIAHLCGHDGHMAMLCGAALRLVNAPCSRGRIVFLFQPAEETGQGAAQVAADPKYKALKPDCIIGLHNIPGAELGRVLLRTGIMTMASCGLTFKFEGKTSHACEPQLGCSPALAIAELIGVSRQISESDRGVLVTVVGAKLGEKAFGTAPGSGELYATLRSSSHDALERSIAELSETASIAAQRDGVKCEVSREDEFAETINDVRAVDIVQEATQVRGLEFETLDRPFMWSEDFGRFTQHTPGALFGFGSGLRQKNLHDPEFDFPDKLLEPGTLLLEQIARTALDASD